MHPEALTEASGRLFPRLSRFKDFYLVGGTALALQIGHRQSVDFDMFTEKKLPSRLMQKVKRVFQGSSVDVTYRETGQIHFDIDGVKMTFFWYEYPVVKRLRMYRGVPLASVLEVAVMKAFSIGRRLSYKDYVDWYFMLKEKRVDLKQVMTTAKKKYGGDFNDRLFLGQLALVTDVQEVPIDFLRDPVNKDTITTFLEDQVRNFPI